MARLEDSPTQIDPVPGPDTGAVIVAGMHRSGTSLVARLLRDSGLDLGAEVDLLPANHDNTEGFWENTRIVELNNAILAALGGAWDVPPELQDGWERDEALDPIRARALELLHAFAGQEAWGWKDPRTSLTLPFWYELLPNARVVVVVRHPLEVARSLESRGSSSRPFALRLWERYNRELLARLDGRDAFVTHYDSYFHDAEAELRRLLEFVELEPPEEAILAAASRVNQFARHHRMLDTSDLPADVVDLYRELCQAAGPVFAQALSRAEGSAASEPEPAPSREPQRAIPVGDPPARGCKYTHFDDSPDSTHVRVVELVPHGARVLEFGCATGYMSRVLRDEKGCKVTAVEVSPDAAAQAEPFCERVIVGDAEELDLQRELGDETFDAVLFADVLEHLRDPGAVLRRVRPFVAEGGSVIASIPNIAHGSVRLSLLAGEFRYRPLGILDDSHLRFFTRATIEDLFESNGYAVLRWLRQHAALDETEIDVAAVPDELLARLESDTEASTYQFIVQAAPSDAAHRLKTARLVLEELRVELEELRPLRHDSEVLRVELEAAQNELEQLRQQELAKLAELRPLRQEVEALRRAHEVRGRRLIAERVAFAEGIAYVQAQVYGSRSWRLTAPLRAVSGLLRRLRG